RAEGAVAVAGGLPLDEPRARAHARAGGDRGEEAQLVRAVVEEVARPHHRVARALARGSGEPRQEREGQEAVRDRRLEGALAPRALDVRVDPLVVAGQLGEVVDDLLGDLELVAPGPELGRDL